MTGLAIAFPAFDPVIVDIGGFQIRWYAVAYIAGIFLGYVYVLRLVRTERIWPDNKPSVTTTFIDDLLLWTALGIILGGRLGYVLFYNFDYFLENPSEILAIWQGGMSFHGGFAGVILAILVYSRLKGAPILSVGDLVAAGTPFGLLFGRIANFINGELYGRVTEVPWGFIFPDGGPLPRHPSQLYEALLEGIVLFLILRLATHRFAALSRPGTVIALFFIFYGVFRTAVEFVRMPDAHIGFLTGGLTMGMVLSIPMIPIGLAFLWNAQRRAATRTGDAS